MAITIQKLTSGTFKVTVTAKASTTHTVTVPYDYYQKLTGGRSTEEALLEKSFEFLLERESNTSILRSFSLPVIQQYFPEYEQTISKRLA